MKPKLALAWFLVSMALTALLVVNWRTSGHQKLKLESVQLQFEKLDQQDKVVRAEKAELEKETQRLRGELRSAELEANNARVAMAALSQATNKLVAPSGRTATAQGRPAEQEGAGGMGAMLSKMMSDPDMRTAMKEQQRMGMDMIYGSLFKHLQLTPDQEKNFKDTLLEMQMANMSQAGDMFGSTNRAAAMQKMNEERQKTEEKLKEILGDEKFGQYQDYNKTLGERMILDQFAKQSDMSPEQGEKLLAIMREEKDRMQTAASTTDPAEQMKMLESDQAAEEMFKKQDQVNEQVLQRAQEVLSAEQMEKFRPFVTNQTAMQRAGIKMARKMMAPNQPAPAPAAPNQ